MIAFGGFELLVLLAFLAARIIPVPTGTAGEFTAAKANTTKPSLTLTPSWKCRRISPHWGEPITDVGECILIREPASRPFTT